MKIQLLFLILLFFISCSDLTQKQAVDERRIPASGDIVLSNTITLTGKQVDEIVSKIKVLEKDQVFYHWTSVSNAYRWLTDNGMNKGELDFLNTPTGDKQVYGPGVYLASDSKSSSYYGSSVVGYKLKSGTPILSLDLKDDIKGIVGERLDDKELSELGKHIPYVRQATSEWYVVNHISNVDEIVNIDLVPDLQNTMIKKAIDGKYRQDIWKTLDHERFIYDHKLGYLDSLLTLQSYMDGIGFYRAIKVNPTNPWSEFEPTNFEDYRNAYKHYYQLGLKNVENTSSLKRSSIFKFGNAKSSTADDQIDNALLDMIGRVSGGKLNASNFIRGNEVRAGGDQNGKTFLATGEFLGNLLKNPYLEVTYEPNPYGKGFLVSYYYPDAVHYKHLKGKMSDELFDQLEEAGVDKIVKNTGMREEFTRKIIRELLTEVFSSSKYDEMISGATFGTAEASLIRDLISIHPFSDFNGRTIRLYVAATLFERWNFFYSGSSGFSDLDLYVTPEKYAKIVNQAQNSRFASHVEMYSELFESASKNRAANFTNTKFFERIFKGFEPLVGDDWKKLTNFSADDLELVKHRKFVDLLNSKIGINWQYRNPEGVLSALALVKGESKLRYLDELIEIDFFKKKGITADLFSSDLIDLDNWPSKSAWKKFIKVLKSDLEPSIFNLVKDKLKGMLREKNCLKLFNSFVYSPLESQSYLLSSAA